MAWALFVSSILAGTVLSFQALIAISSFRVRESSQQSCCQCHVPLRWLSPALGSPCPALSVVQFFWELYPRLPPAFMHAGLPLPEPEHQARARFAGVGPCLDLLWEVLLIMMTVLEVRHLFV